MKFKVPVRISLLNARSEKFSKWWAETWTWQFSRVIQVLIGRDNYHDWATVMEAVLEHEDFWDTIKAPQNGVLSTDPKKIKKAHAKIILFIDPLIYQHVRDCTTGKDA